VTGTRLIRLAALSYGATVGVALSGRLALALWLAALAGLVVIASLFFLLDRETRP
jgi:hypothetical protein